MFSVRFEGGRAMASNLERLSKRLSRSILREALKEAAEPMRRAMSQKAPRDRTDPEQPALAESIVVGNARGEDAQEVAIAIGPSRDTYYGSFQELGTAEFPAQPFVRPGFDETVHATLRLFGDGVWRELAGQGLHRPSVEIDVPVEGEV